MCCFSYIGPFNLSTIALKDVSKALEDNPEGAPGGIKAHFRMDENGLLTLESVRTLTINVYLLHAIACCLFVLAQLYVTEYTI